MSAARENGRPSPQPLDLTTSVQMAKVAYAVYGHRSSPLTNNTWQKARWTDVSEFTTRHVHCRVGYWHSGTRASVVVAFRGSSTGAEWANNAPHAVWEPASPILAGRVHPGFNQSLSEVWKEVVEAIQQRSQTHLAELLGGYASGRSVPLCFVGHSRGGALAILGGLRALTTFVLPVRVYTFGAPRVGDRDFAEAYKAVFQHGASVHWRFESEGDPVPVVPFILQAQHIGSLVYLRKGARTVQILETERPFGRRGLRAVPQRFLSIIG